MIYQFINWFLIGVISAISSLAMEMVILTGLLSSEINWGQYTYSLGWFFFVIILIEEFTKTILSYLKISRNPSTSSPNLILWGIAGGGGFALTESFLLNLKNESFFNWGVYLIHIATFFSIIYLLKLKGRSLLFKISAALIVGIILHTAYNLFIFYY